MPLIANQLRSVIGERQGKAELNDLPTIMASHLVPKFAHVSALFRHSDDLIASRNERPNSDVLSQLPMPPNAGCWFVIFKVFRHIGVQCVVDHFYNKLPPPFWTAV